MNDFMPRTIEEALQWAEQTYRNVESYRLTMLQLISFFRIELAYENLDPNKGGSEMGRTDPVDVVGIAKVGHQANKAYCESIGDTSQKDWDAADQWQRDSMIAGVRFLLANPDATPEDQHNAWCEKKRADGWTYGPDKDSEKKTHPCLVPYKDLPLVQRRKDFLFRGIFKALLTE